MGKWRLHPRIVRVSLFYYSKGWFRRGLHLPLSGSKCRELGLEVVFRDSVTLSISPFLDSDPAYGSGSFRVKDSFRWSRYGRWMTPSIQLG